LWGDIECPLTTDMFPWHGRIQKCFLVDDIDSYILPVVLLYSSSLQALTRMSTWDPLNVKNCSKKPSLNVSEWHSLGIQLDILPHKLKELEEYPPHQRKCHMIEKWLENDPNQSWEKLLEGLKKIGHNHVAQQILSQYRKGPSSGRLSVEETLAEMAITTPSQAKVPQHQEGTKTNLCK